LPADSPKQKPAIAAFISYAKADQEKAQAIADQLEARGFRCWIAPRDVKPGRAYGDEIIRGIERARCLVLVLSSASNDSGFVSREIERAVSKNKPIFTIRVENVEPAPALELFISGTQWIDAFSGRFATHIDRLAGLLAEQDGVEPVPPPPEDAPERRQMPRWLLPAGGGAAALIAGLAGLVIWLGQSTAPPIDPSLLTNPTWLQGEAQQVAANSARDAEGAKPGDGSGYAATPEAAGASPNRGSPEDGFFGPDTRLALSDFAGAERERLSADYGYVGALVQDGQAVCNATLVGRDLILTSNYCFGGRDPSGMLFRVLDREGRPFESKVTDVAVSAPIRGASASQRVAVATLADALGDQVGWVKSLGGSPAIGQKLDIVAIDVRQGTEGEETKVAGASTGDGNCVVLARDANSDTFAHRCVSPPGSGGAPIFDTASGSLLGIVGETDSRRRMGIAYRVDGAPGLGLASVTCTVNDPTGTPLNVRSDPNGDVVGTLANGIAVAVVESRIASNGKGWVKVADPKTQSPIGWVFRDFVSCS
jgi:hypothetical protein